MKNEVKTTLSIGYPLQVIILNLNEVLIQSRLKKLTKGEGAEVSKNSAHTAIQLATTDQTLHSIMTIYQNLDKLDSRKC